VQRAVGQRGACHNWGGRGEPLLAPSMAHTCSCWAATACLAPQARWESEQHSPARSTTSSVGTIALPSTPSYTGDAPSLFRFRRCWKCEPQFGREDDQCRAQDVLGSLEAEAEEQDEEVLQAEAVRPAAPNASRVHAARHDRPALVCGARRCMLRCLWAQAGEVSRLARRAARYYLYRKWVFLAHGKLGKRTRVRIPPCVVELIRYRYREPGCQCRLGGELYACTEHGYTGHREAYSDEEEESML